MRRSPVPACRAAGVAALGCAFLMLSPLAAQAAEAATTTGTETGPMKAAMAEYRKKLAAYNKAYDAYEKVAGPYWRAVTDKRSRRRTKVANHMQITADDYVMTQPPVYTGPEKPDNPLQPGKQRSDTVMVWVETGREPSAPRLVVERGVTRDFPAITDPAKGLRIVGPPVAIDDQT